MFTLLLLASCVTPSHHELVVMQLDATRAALSAQQASSREESADLETQLTALEHEIDMRQAQLDLLTAQHISHEADLEALRERYAALLAEAKATAVPPPTPAPLRPSPHPKVPLAPIPPPTPVLDASVAEMKAALAVSADDAFQKKRAAQRFGLVQDRFKGLVADGFATVEQHGSSAVVVILAAKLFNEGTVELSPRGEDIAKRAATAMAGMDGWDVEIEGHTDVAPYHSPELPSNWELGFARGIAVLRALQQAGMDETAHVTSFAGTEPRFPTDAPDAARENARVEIWLSEIPDIDKRFAPTPPKDDAPTKPDPTVPPKDAPPSPG